MSKNAIVAWCSMCRQRVATVDGRFVTHPTEILGGTICAGSTLRATDKAIMKGQK